MIFIYYAAFESSPIAYLHNWKSPVLVISGDSDRNVAVQETIGLIRALRRKGDVEVKSIMFPVRIDCDVTF